MTGLFGLFFDNLLPIILAAGAGYFFARWLRVDPQPLSQAAFYIFAPCLIYNLLVTSQLSNGDILRMAGFAAVIMLSIVALTWLAGWLLHLKRRILAAVLLASVFMNAGNFGLPVVLFAFNEGALAYASVFFITNAVMVYTLGVFIASLGTSGLLRSFTNLLRVPTLYALVLALLVMRTGWQLPVPVERTINLLGQASIPTILIMLGIQFYRLREVNFTDIDNPGQGNTPPGRKAILVPLLLATGIRLVVSPALAAGLAPIFHLQGPALQAGVVEAGMPGAVLATVLATEYDVEPSYVTAMVFFSTLLSPLTLTLLLAYLGG